MHIFSDEAKYQADKKVNAAFPILRGDKEYFGASVYFLGFTVTTDMPSVTEGEYDWIFRYAKSMNVERMKLILLTFDQLNKARIKLYNEYQTRRDPKEMERLETKIEEWERRYQKVRHDQTFFITASSLVNIQHLTVKYITGLIATLETHDFNKSVLSIRPKLKKSLRFYPIEAEDFEDLRASLEKLQLNDASLTFQPESSLALGFGFRCGFLGLLHMEIVQERLDREFDMNVITTVPNVSYKVYDKQGNMAEIHNPGGMPDPTLIDRIEEPYIKASVITTTDYIGPIMTLCLGKRGELIKQEYISGNRVEIHYNMPLGEIVIDFYDKLKSISKGYASFDYHTDGFRPSKLIKMDILLNSEPVDALSTLTHVDNAYELGKRMCEKLKELIPRQQFDIAIQAAIGSKIISRETIKAVRKDVTAKCYGGDISRKRKLLEKQKKGKKRMKQIGNVEVPQKAPIS